MRQTLRKSGKKLATRQRDAAHAKARKVSRRSRKPVATAARKTAHGKVPAAESDIRVFQVFFERWHKKSLDPDFIPLDGIKESSQLRQFALASRLVESDALHGATLWGIAPRTFYEDTGMTGAQWVQAIRTKPGFDIYYCNPSVLNEALYHNFWMQGQTALPRFLELARAFYEAAGLPVQEISELAPSSEFVSPNYVVAVPVFWERYLSFIGELLSAAEKKLSTPMLVLLKSRPDDPAGLYSGASHVPFIVERLLPHFLRTIGKDFTVCRIPCPQREAELNVHLALLRHMKDLAHQARSALLATYWMNYRNLYVMQVFGQSWAQAHLSKITPVKFTFAATSTQPIDKRANAAVGTPHARALSEAGVAALKQGLPADLAKRSNQATAAAQKGLDNPAGAKSVTPPLREAVGSATPEAQAR